MKTLLFVALLTLSPLTLAEPSSTKHLADFESLQVFDDYLDETQQTCIDNALGGARTVACFGAYEQAWDYELNHYYKLLRSVLSDEDKAVLKQAQLAWIKYRDETSRFNRRVVSKKYEGQSGSMYTAIRAGDESNVDAPVIRERALLLRQWYLGLSEE